VFDIFLEYTILLVLNVLANAVLDAEKEYDDKEHDSLVGPAE